MKLDRNALYEKELAKLRRLFSEVDPAKAELVEGLMTDAAFLMAENTVLKKIAAETGTIKVHPEYPEIQKPTEVAKQYLRNVNSYATVIKTLNGILAKDSLEQDDAFDEFLKEYYGGKD